MAKKKINFSKMDKPEWEAHFEGRRKLAAYYEKKGYDSLTEISPQSYIVYINGQLWDVYREEEFEGTDKWMCRHSTDKSLYLDPLPTLKACREAITAMRAGGTATMVKAEVKEKRVEADKPKHPNYRLTKDLDVEVAEDDINREHAEVVTWTCGHTILGRQVLEITETYLKVQLDYGIAWVPMSGIVLSSEYATKCLSQNEVDVLLDALNRQLCWNESLRGDRMWWSGPTKNHNRKTVEKLMPYLKRVEYNPLLSVYGLKIEGMQLLSDMGKLPKKDNA